MATSNYKKELADPGGTPRGACQIDRKIAQTRCLSTREAWLRTPLGCCSPICVSHAGVKSVALDKARSNRFVGAEMCAQSNRASMSA